jgi:hypothetical protein
VTHDLNVLALMKGPERYIFVYDDMSRDEILQAIRDRAACPDSTFTWADAAILTLRLREQEAEASSAIERKSSESTDRLML